jgi:ATP-dependent Lon protease
MTGEITLRGQVLPVGGIKEKMLAAHRAGLTTVVLPKRNEADLEEIPEDVRKQMKFVLVEAMDEVLAAALPSRYSIPPRRERKARKAVGSRTRRPSRPDGGGTREARNTKHTSNRRVKPNTSDKA